MKNVFVVYKGVDVNFTCTSLRSAKEYADKHGFLRIVEYSIIGHYPGTDLEGRRIWMKRDIFNKQWREIDYCYIKQVR